MDTAATILSVLHSFSAVWHLSLWHLFAQSAAPVVITALWQGIAVALGLAVCLRIAPRIPAAQRFAAWAAGFAVLILLPLLPMLAHLGAGVSSGAAMAQPEAAAHPLLQLNLRWGMALAALWAAVSAIRAADLALHTLRLRRLWKNAVPVPESQLAATLPATEMWGRKPVELCTTQELDRPSVIGFIAPRILVPDWLMARLTPGELDQIVLHETEHLRRRDDWTNLLQKLALVLFPLNPALWWMERRLCQEREMACDEGVIRITHAPRAYAACLTSLAERGLEKRNLEMRLLEKRVLERRAAALSLGAWQRRPELVHRVHSILRRKHALHPVATHAVLALVGCGLVAGSMELARCPQLVAFVPAQVHAAAAQQASVGLHTASARLLPAALHTSRAAHAGHAVLRPVLSGPAKAAPLLASLDAGTDAASAVRIVAQVDTPAEAEQARAHAPRAWDVMESSQPVSAPRQQALEAAAQPDRQYQPDQQYIVLAAWEQVETTGQLPGSAGEPLQASSAQPAVRTADLRAPHTRGAQQVTVTRLILSVYSANSISSRAALAALHSGWLVLQL